MSNRTEHRPADRYLTVNGTPVTPAGLQVHAVLGVDGDEVLFTASAEPTETHLWTYRAADGIRKLTSEPAVHDGVRRAGTLVHVARGSDRPGGRTVVARDGQPAVPVASLAERPVLDVHATRLVLGPRELRAVLYLPSWHRLGEGRLPILADPYGGAGLQRVTAELNWRFLMPQWLAEQGFAVLVADGSGTPGRGPAWEREVYGDVYGPVLQDQVTAVQETARLYPDLDPGRVGIRGWSFGGSLARGPCCTGPMSSTSRWPGRASPTSGCTTRTGGSGSWAIPTSSPSGTRPSPWSGRHPS